MKKLLLSLMAAITTGIVTGQVAAPTVTIPNFNVTSTTGQTYSLYTELAKGKNIIVDMFYVTCSYCIQHAPTIEQIYQAKGAGTGNVEIWGLDDRTNESNAQVNSYKTAHGITNPCFANSGGSYNANGDIVIAFGLGGVTYSLPSYVVICGKGPYERKAYWHVNYPPTLTGFDQYLTKCATTSTGVDNIVHDETQARFVSIYPNPSNNASKIDFFLAERGNVEMVMFNLLGEQVGVLANQTFDSGTHTIDFSQSNLPSGNYMIKMITENGIADVAKVMMTN